MPTTISKSVGTPGNLEILASLELSLIHRFPVVLLDMNGTFMFDGDRFGPGESYAATCRALGGTLPDEVVNVAPKPPRAGLSSTRAAAHPLTHTSLAMFS